jgi:PhzF family phenazine biosynthesis protein
MQDPPRPSIPIFQVDAFAAGPFSGNPAAVCLLPSPRPDDWLQSVAAEMNLSETAFLLPSGGDDGARFGLRWFTPATEVELCGHATLASAHSLWESGRVPAGAAIRFDTASGELTCELEESAPVPAGAGGAGPSIWMDFPAQPATELAGEERGVLVDGLSRALGAPPVRIARSRFDLLVELGSEATVRGLRPDMVGLAAVDARGVIVTAAGEEGGEGEDHDFVSRFFAPRVGVPEDPVTGSAHCCLAPWWAERLGRARLTGYQASRRGGVVRTELRGNRVRLGGAAVTVFTGELSV